MGVLTAILMWSITEYVTNSDRKLKKAVIDASTSRITVSEQTLAENLFLSVKHAAVIFVRVFLRLSYEGSSEICKYCTHSLMFTFQSDDICERRATTKIPIATSPLASGTRWADLPRPTVNKCSPRTRKKSGEASPRLSFIWLHPSSQSRQSLRLKK